MIKPFVFAVALVAYALLGAQSLAEGEPDLATSQAWLINVLPKEHMGVSLLGSLRANVYEYSFAGCTLVINQGVWTGFGTVPSPLDYNTVEVMFEPRAGLSFYSRPMTHDERLAIKTSHTDLSGTFSGNVHTINFSLVRISSFKVESGFPIGMVVLQSVVTDGKNAFFNFDTDEGLAERAASALQRVSKLCGAQDDPY